MDGAAFRERVETEMVTELDRLGSNKLLIALTEADLSTPAVLRTAAGSEYAARETFREWAGDEPSDAARAAFEAAAEREADHLDRVVAEMDAPFDPPDGPGAIHAYLRGRESTVERVAGGLVGRELVGVRTHTQVIGFFINEADERRADLFRELKGETEAALADGLDLLEDLCSGDDWERAEAVATYTIRVAYDEYADALAGMGVDPKPVC